MVIVLSADFTAKTKLSVVLPITTCGEFARRIGFAVSISGIKTTVVVRCDQPRVLDLQARDGHNIDALPAAILEDVMAKVATIFAS